jgi:ABC-type cobalamin transport system permease subunit
MTSFIAWVSTHMVDVSALFGGVVSFIQLVVSTIKKFKGN